MSDFPKRKVSDMGNVQGGRQRSPHLTEGPMTPYLRVANVFDGYIDTSDVLEMPFTEAEYQRYVLQPGDLLLNEGQSLELVGRCAKYEGEPQNCCFQNTLVRFQAGPECETNYAYQLFRWCQLSGVFAQIATKTNSIAHLGSTRFAELELPFPPLPEQVKIASILSQWDDSLSILSRLLEAKRQQKRGLAEQLLTGKRRLKGFEGEWEETELFRVMKESRIPAEDELGKRLTVSLHLKGVSVREERDNSETGKTIYYRRKAGQFIYGKQNIFRGSIGVVPATLDGYLSSQDLPAFDISGDYDVDFVFELFARPSFYESLEQIATGTGSKRVHPETLYKLKIPFPTLPEQQAIASVLSTLDAEISALALLKDKIPEQKRGLMDVLLTGRVRVQV